MTRDPLVERLALLETGQVSDVLDDAGLPNHAVASHIVPLAPGPRIAGRAACVSGDIIVQSVHPQPSVPADALEQVAGPDTVMVIATGGFTGGACLGGFVAYSLQREGCVGLVTDGAVRDADEIRGLGFPLHAAAITPVNSARRWRLTAMNVPVTLPGQGGSPVRVRPGDLILADGDGIVVVPAEIAEQVIADTEELGRIEKRIGEGLRAGGRRPDVFKANPRFAHVRRA